MRWFRRGWDEDSDGGGGFASAEDTRELAQELGQGTGDERAQALRELCRMGAYELTGSQGWPEVADALSLALDDADAWCVCTPHLSPVACTTSLQGHVGEGDATLPLLNLKSTWPNLTLFWDVLGAAGAQAP